MPSSMYVLKLPIAINENVKLCFVYIAYHPSHFKRFFYDAFVMSSLLAVISAPVQNSSSNIGTWTKCSQTYHPLNLARR